MIIDVITIFPDMFRHTIAFGVLREAFDKGLCELNIYDLRDFSEDRHRKVDDRPYGGGPGMVMMIQPMSNAIDYILEKNRVRNIKENRLVLLSPKGKRLHQETLKKMSRKENIIIICGRYEGIDQRIEELYRIEKISIGDYVLTGGEIPAMVLIDGVVRNIEGVLGEKESLVKESFEDGLLDYPQYTRPPVFKGLKVPDILLSGNHKLIGEWRRKKSIDITKENRPDLFDK